VAAGVADDLEPRTIGAAAPTSTVCTKRRDSYHDTRGASLGRPPSRLVA
jgi:hypothetical protein